MRLCLIVVVTLFSLASCREHDKKPAPSKTGNDVFADYRVTGDADKDVVTVVLRFRDGEVGEPIPLAAPASVELDGETLRADSAIRGGTFYEAVKPAAAFAGSHRIRYTDEGGKQHEEGFVYQPFLLQSELPATVVRKPFSIRLASFPETATTVQLVMADTSFASPDVNEDAIIRGGELQITARHLAALADGPVILEIYRDDESPVAPFGRIVLSYGLRRQFALIR